MNIGRLFLAHGDLGISGDEILTFVILFVSWLITGVFVVTNLVLILRAFLPMRSKATQFIAWGLYAVPWTILMFGLYQIPWITLADKISFPLPVKVVCAVAIPVIAFYHLVKLSILLRKSHREDGSKQ